MNTIKIGNEERSLRDIDAQWITQQIVNRRKDGFDVCVIISVTAPDIDVRFATPGCGGGGGGGRELRPGEQELLDLWVRHRLNDEDFPPGGVVAFVQQVRRLI